MLRWHLWARGGVQIALHKWLRSDSDRALHDHKSDNISILLSGRYREQFNHAWEAPRSKMRWPLIPYFRRAETPHRIQLVNGPVWTIWIRFAPRRDWGFYCPKGWTHWKDFLGIDDYKQAKAFSVTVGRGCDD